MTDTSKRPPTIWPLMVVLLLLLLPMVASNTGTTDECPLNEYEVVPEGYRWEDDILLAGRPERRYLPSQYRRRTDVAPGYEMCSCVHKPCVIKCCPEGKVYVKGTCSISNETHEKFAVPKLVTKDGTVEAYETDKVHIVYKKLKCIDNTSKYSLIPSNVENYVVSENGSLYSVSGLYITQPGQFCLEQFHLEFRISYLVCSPVLAEETSIKDINMYYIYSMILSLPFLFVTFMVYALIKALRNLHGKSLMCHVTSLFVAYLSLIIVQLKIKTADDDFCVILAYIIQFSFLASFFWLNVMCFDLWWTFSERRPLRGHSIQYESKKFIIYSIYAWGCSSVISIITYYMHNASFLQSYKSLYPGFGEESCWFSTTSATVTYFYGPIAIILISNLIMFMNTAVMIYKKIKDTKIFNQSDCSIDHEKQRFVLYLNLFVVMGVNWLAEVISFAFEENVEAYIWYITDFGNALQGVLIFLIFVCKKRVFRLIKEELCPRNKHMISTNVSTRNLYNNSIVSKSQFDLELNTKNTNGVIPSIEQNSTNNL